MEKNYQAIFQFKHCGMWMDYARERVIDVAHARRAMMTASADTGHPFRVSVEDWSETGTREPTVYVGDWDKAELSPAAQETGVFVDA